MLHQPWGKQAASFGRAVLCLPKALGQHRHLSASLIPLGTGGGAVFRQERTTKNPQPAQPDLPCTVLPVQSPTETGFGLCKKNVFSGELKFLTPDFL